MQDNKPLTTRRNKAHYGDRAIINGRPVANVKSRKTEDYVTLEEFAEDLIGQPVEKVMVILKPALIE